MSFHVAAEAYDRYMGRYSVPLAAEFAAAAGIAPGALVLDVGAGTGALTGRLLELGAHVTAVEPSDPFATALRERQPGIEVWSARAEDLPFADGRFDAALAQLVVHFMADPVAGLREMTRVTRAGGTVAACVWDHAGGGPLREFWAAVREVTPGAPDESQLPGAREGDLPRLLAEAGLADVRAGVLRVRLAFASFEEWWEPFTLGVGPGGAHVAGLDGDGRRALRDACAARLPSAPFEVGAAAWCAVGRVPGA